MGAFSYYLTRKTKNQLIQFMRSPAKVIYALIFASSLAMTLTSVGVSSQTQLSNTDELYVVLWAVYTFVFVTVSKNGFSNGSSLFSMADANLIFTSPIKNTSVLIHAMLQQLGRSAFVGVIFLLQYGTVNRRYGVGYGTFLLMVLFYGLTVFCGQMLSVVIYTFCSSGEVKAKLIKALYYSVIGIFSLYGLYVFFKNGIISFGGAVKCLSEDIFSFFPISGFFVMILEGLENQLTGKILTGVLLLTAFAVLFFLVVLFKKFDFYEDVITSAEMSSSMGNTDPDSVRESMPKKIKLGKTGFDKGFGAAAVFEKNKTENRRGHVFYVDTVTVVYAVICAVSAFIFDYIWLIFALNIYLTMFSVSAGRWVRELKLHYIYLIPEKNSKKLFNMIKEQMPMHLVQSVVIIVPLTIILKLGIIETVSLILARFSFCLLFTGTTLLMKRIFSSTDKGAFYGFIYMIFCLLFSLPAIMAALLISMMYIFNFEFVFLVLSAVNTVVALCLIYFNRNILEKGM